MKCKVCGRAMTLLFTSFACDYCDGLNKPSSNGRPFAWLALMLIDGNEVSAPEYERQRVEFEVFEPTGCLVGLGDSWTFPVAVSSWGVVERAALMDSKTKGNAFHSIHMSCPRTIISGDQITFWFQFVVNKPFSDRILTTA